jgi:hypothetical protein
VNDLGGLLDDATGELTDRLLHAARDQAVQANSQAPGGDPSSEAVAGVDEEVAPSSKSRTPAVKSGKAEAE